LRFFQLQSVNNGDIPEEIACKNTNIIHYIGNQIVGAYSANPNDYYSLITKNRVEEIPTIHLTKENISEHLQCIFSTDIISVNHERSCIIG